MKISRLVIIFALFIVPLNLMDETDLNVDFIGINIVAKALRMPCMTIAKNAGLDASVVVSKVEDLSQDTGYDALNNEYVNMIERGIIDPTKVISD